jgi:hypothetical protein
MSARTDPKLAEAVYQKWHSNEFDSQRSLARAFGLTFSTVSHIVKGAGHFAELRKKFPHQRTKTPTKKSGRPANVPQPQEVDEPEIDLAMEAIEELQLKPAAAVVLARTAFAELSELLRITRRPCPRLEKYLGPHPGRPNQKDSEAVKHVEETELAESEVASEEFLKEEA